MTDKTVTLSGDKSASQILFEVLDAAVKTFELPLDAITWPSDAGRFRKRYVDILPRLEAVRLAHPQRHEIAQQMAESILDYLLVGDESIAEHLRAPAEPLTLRVVKGTGEEGWSPCFFHEDRSWQNVALLGQQLNSERVVSRGAADSLNWLQQNILDHKPISLHGRKVVVLGAAAEMASTREFLLAGADVLWIDRAPPGDWFLEGTEYSGTLHYTEAAADLLTQPAQILATINAFADGNPVDLCLYAYAPGQAREIRLTGVMCAMVNAMAREAISSVTILVSPTTPSSLSEDDLSEMQSRRDGRPFWEGALNTLGLLGSGGGYCQQGNHATIRSLVSIQGASYQAAQYLCKVIMAETWATSGLSGASSNEPIRVSANTAAITQTKSLDHPVFDAAFGGAEAMQVLTLTPEQSQCLNALLAITDWLREEMPVPGAVRIHGGIHTLPYPLESALVPAAAIGFTKSPGLLLGLIRANLRRFRPV